jgi:hypothetical protein
MAMMTADKASSGNANVVWDGTDYDTDGFWSAASPSRLTIPAGKGIKKIRLSLNLTPADSSLSGSHFVQFGKNGGGSFRGCSITGGTVGDGSVGLAVTGPVIAVSDGDYFEAYYSSSDAARTWQAARCYFSIEVVEATATI